MNATGGRGVLYEAFPSWLSNTKIKHLVEHCARYDGYFIVHLDLEYSTFNYYSNCFLNFIRYCLLFLFSFIITIITIIIIIIILYYLGQISVVGDFYFILYMYIFIFFFFTS